MYSIWEWKLNFERESPEDDQIKDHKLGNKGWRCLLTQNLIYTQKLLIELWSGLIGSDEASELNV